MEQTINDYCDQYYGSLMVREKEIDERISRIGSGGMKDYDELDFTDDFLFCKILEENPDVCEELASLILGQEIHLVNIHKQESVKVSQDGKGVKMDVFADDDRERIFDIEMQTTKKKNIAKRSRYYQGIIDTNQLEVGLDYDQLSDCYIIFICTFDPVGYDLPKYTFRNICMEDRNIILDEGTAKVFLNTQSSKIEMSLELAALFEYIKTKEATDQLTQKIDDLVHRAREKEQWRKEYMWHRDAYETDIKREVYGVGHADGKAEGKVEGQKEGREMERSLLIHNMSSSGVSVEAISQMTSIPLEEVREILSKTMPD